MGAPIATLRDDFEDNLIAAAWTSIVAGSATVTEASGRATLTLPSSTAGSHTAYYRSASTYDLTGDGCYININTMVATGVAATMTFDLLIVGSGNNVLRWQQLSNTITARKVVAGVDTQLYTATWSGTTYKYLRIRESSGTIYFDSSSTGTSWTNRATIVGLPFAITDLSVQFGASCGNVASPGSLKLDDLNVVLPALTTNWRWTQIVWPFTERFKVVTLALDTAGTAQAYVAFADSIDANGDPVSPTYWSGPADGGRELTSQATQAAAQAMAVNIPVDGRFDLPSIQQGHVIRVYHRSVDGSAYTLREVYPRRLVQSDDIEAESIKAINVAASAITVDKLDATLTITGKTIQTDYAGARVVLSGDTYGGLIGYGATDTYDPATGSGTYQILWSEADGKFYAGAGKVILDDDGVTFAIVADSDETSNNYNLTKVKWLSSSREVGYVGAQDYFDAQNLVMYATAPANAGGHSYSASVQMYTKKTGSAAIPNVFVQVDSGGIGSAGMSAGGGLITLGDDTSVTGGLNVGSASGASTGQIKTSGQINTTSNYATNSTVVMSTRRTGWGQPTGTATRSTFATSTVTLSQLAERVKALIDDLNSSSSGHGLIGP